jgi:hypothetical protein
MFGKQSMQVVSLKDLTEFVQGVLPVVQQPVQPQYMPQAQLPSNTTTVTIYIQELHIHQPGSGQVERQMLPGQQRMAELPAPRQAESYTLSDYGFDAVGAHPALLRCAQCGHEIPRSQEVSYRGVCYHPSCYSVMVEEMKPFRM